MNIVIYSTIFVDVHMSVYNINIYNEYIGIYVIVYAICIVHMCIYNSIWYIVYNV